MDTVKTRKQGNAIMVTLSKKLNITEGQEFYITKEEDGTIALIPKVEDYFKNAKQGQFVDEEDVIAANFITEGQELNDE
ncbi:AbrB family transcriptional regulator (plasmid) [Staphylococcus warneri]|uniref:type II toxin-antitoxin system PemI/MazE family antitoxin n=1 Tax=Staphylococcus capitis TaxID=29388 RepID=UPI00118B669D|nr:AbrB family transcriptional regulator [Staphylococcus capitis]MCM3509016.1 AbrB family transcriptional regulator [Staphylococcus capitis]QDW97633.1 AbrB family transcriptional regulator [Staphylococcus warneri]HEK6547131.1 AbrB family transcriptional regulator [Staphylococcus aureus]